MSTERKPGSRGITNVSSGDRANVAPLRKNEPGPRDGQKAKGSTKTVSPSKAYKKKPKKR